MDNYKEQKEFEAMIEWEENNISSKTESVWSNEMFFEAPFRGW